MAAVNNLHDILAVNECNSPKVFLYDLTSGKLLNKICACPEFDELT